MYTRRKVLMVFIWFVPFLFAPRRLLSNIYDNASAKKGAKFIKQGWVLQEGDV